MGKRSKTKRRSRASAVCRYETACRLAVAGRSREAQRIYQRIVEDMSAGRLRALARNDIAALAAVDGQMQAAVNGFRVALELDRNCEPARLNLALVEADLAEEVRGQKSEVGSHGSAVTGEKEVSGKGAEGRCRRPQIREQGLDVDRLSVAEAVRARRPTTDECPGVLLLFVTYNRLEYSRLALDAVLELDYPNLEIVIWDNGSTDGTAEYLKKRLARVRGARLERSPRNRGIVHAMNAVWGARHETELLMKIDNDTLIPPDLIRRLAECHAASDRFGVLSGFHFRAEGEAIAPPKDILSVNGVQVLRQKYVGGCAVMIRREVYERFGPVPEGLGFGDQKSEIRGQRSEGDGPFLESGWTMYQRRLHEAGMINGYPWPPVHVDHMEDTRSPHCIRSESHEQYKQAMRGMNLDEFTQELCVWRPH